MALDKYGVFVIEAEHEIFEFDAWSLNITVSTFSF